MAKTRGRWFNHPELLTLAIATPSCQLTKLRWNYDQFEAAALASPSEQNLIAFTAIDFCIAATALRDWVQAEREADQTGYYDDLAIPRGKDFIGWSRRMVAFQLEADSIARAAKHATYRDEDWPGGVVGFSVEGPLEMREEIEALGKRGSASELRAFVRSNGPTVRWRLDLSSVGSSKVAPALPAFGETLDGWASLLFQHRWYLRSRL